MTNWYSDMVQVNGHAIHFYRTGSQKSALTLLHGFSDNSLCWQRAAQPLQATYDLEAAAPHGQWLLALWDKPEPEIMAVRQRGNPTWSALRFGPRAV